MLSEAQKSLIEFGEEDGTISLSVGAIRSGKTYAGLLGFLLHTQSLDCSYKHLVLGRRFRVLKHEIVPTVKEFANLLGVPFDYKWSEAIMTIGAQSYHLAAGNDERSLDRLQGLTAHSAFIDEATLLPESFFETAISRLTYPQSKAWITCNPSSPSHYVKAKWLDKGRIAQHITFGLDDNPALSEKVKDRYRQSFDGVFSKRMIDGIWCAAEGVIYPEWYEGEPPNEGGETYAGADYGTSSPSAFIAIQRHGRTWYAVDELYVDGSTEKVKTDRELAEMLMLFAEEWNIRAIALDPAAASFRAELIRAPGRAFAVRKAVNDVLPGIRVTGSALAHKKLIIHPRCKRLIQELQSYVWMEEEKPLKQDDHAVDALRYAVMDRMPKSVGGVTLKGTGL